MYHQQERNDKNTTIYNTIIKYFGTYTLSITTNTHKQKQQHLEYSGRHTW